MKHPESRGNATSLKAEVVSYISLVSLVELLFKLVWSFSCFRLSLQILLLRVVIVKGIIHVFVIINPASNHMRVLLMEMHACWVSMKKNWLIVADLICGQCSGSIEEHLTPQVRVRTRLVHSSIGFKVFFDVEFILLKHGVDFLLVCRVEDLLEVSSHTVLLIVDSVNIGPTNREDMLSQKLSHHTPKKLMLSGKMNTCKV